MYSPICIEPTARPKTLVKYWSTQTLQNTLFPNLVGCWDQDSRGLETLLPLPNPKRPRRSAFAVSHLVAQNAEHCVVVDLKRSCSHPISLLLMCYRMRRLHVANTIFPPKVRYQAFSFRTSLLHCSTPCNKTWHAICCSVQEPISPTLLHGWEHSISRREHEQLRKQTSKTVDEHMHSNVNRRQFATRDACWMLSS